MNKTELIKEVAAKAEVSQKVAAAVVNATIDTIVASLAKGDSVQILGLGTFEVRSRAARTSRNPATGATVQIPAKKAPAFKVSKALKDAIK
ncbi:MAG: HU family DNA-binding protein [Clostridia bacterium]|nr:HU family DNA-binding protein [Clostridia bacterium]MBQ3928288.1 HU family DNA-binding protein [Clostridia bacterium]